MTRRPHAGRAGFTLIELLAVMSVLAVLLGIIVITILTLMRLHQTDATAFQRLTDHERLADQFRADVVQAHSAPEQWAEFQAGKHCLILELDRNTIVVFQRDKAGLRRWHVQADQKTSQSLPLGSDDVEFVRTDPRLLKMRLTASHGPRARFPSEIAAALGGERR